HAQEIDAGGKDALGAGEDDRSRGRVSQFVQLGNQGLATLQVQGVGFAMSQTEYANFPVMGNLEHGSHLQSGTQEIANSRLKSPGDVGWRRGRGKVISSQELPLEHPTPSPSPIPRTAVPQVPVEEQNRPGLREHDLLLGMVTLRLL